MTTTQQTAEQCIVAIGKESAGKSQLVSALTGRRAYASNFRGATVACETYRCGERAFVDTPGIVRQSDTATTRAALERVQASDAVLLVVQATHLDEDLAHLLPLARGKRGAVVVTFWDKVDGQSQASQALEQLSAATGLAFVPVDARRVSAEDRRRILQALDEAAPIPTAVPGVRVGWRIEPARTILEVPYVGPLVSLVLLLAPAIAAVWVANTFAALVDPLVKDMLAPLVGVLGAAPSPLRDILVGDYGLVTMGPLLFVWAIPTVILYALFLGAYKASGLLDRVSVAMHPVMRPFGLSGRDLLRVIMGFGCNVPAVVSTRACSSCSRGACISAIAFGSACSYQFGATLAVFAAANLSWLVVPYVVFLTATTLVYVRLTAPPAARSPLNVLLVEGRTFLEWPRWSSIWRESRTTVIHFFRKAVPIFIGITAIASVLGWLGAITHVAGVLAPLMALFGLPPEAALPVVMASIRKDGILLFAEKSTLATLSAGQVLTAVYLAGVLLPCLVTAFTIAREQSKRFLLALVARQALTACAFSLVLMVVVRLLGW
jgi:ferrous iron transport protein B